MPEVPASLRLNRDNLPCAFLANKLVSRQCWLYSIPVQKVPRLLDVDPKISCLGSERDGHFLHPPSSLPLN